MFVMRKVSMQLVLVTRNVDTVKKKEMKVPTGTLAIVPGVSGETEFVL